MNATWKVVWAEGVFLGQQHFQLWDQYFEASLQQRTRLQSPFAWGLISASINEDALARGQFRLEACELILPDGRLAALDSADEPLVCDLAGAPAERVDIHLGLPTNHSVEGIGGYQSGGRLCAWRATYRNVPDHHDPARVREVMLGSPNLVLLRGDEPREQFAALKLAELVHQGDGHYRLDERFIPSVCRLDAASALEQLLARVNDLVAAKVRVLDERRERFGGVADFGPSELSQFLLLQTLRPALAMLNHLRAHPDLPPERLYCELVKLIAALKSFRPEAGVEDWPGYRHHDLGGVLHRLEDLLRTLLADAVASHLRGLELKREHDALYSVAGIDSRLLERASFFLAVQHDSADPAWVGDFARQVKAGSREDIELIVASALPGVRLVHTQRPPNRLPVKSGYEYFRIEPKGEFWERVLDHHSLGVFLPGAFAKAQVELVTVEE